MGTANMSESINAYRCGDLESFIDFNLAQATLEEFEQLGLTSRNIDMAKKINDIIKSNPGERSLFAVGAAHWQIGENSLENLLSGYGYSLEHIPHWHQDDAENLSNEACGVRYDARQGVFVPATSPNETNAALMVPDSIAYPSTAPLSESAQSPVLTTNEFLVETTAPTSVSPEVATANLFTAEAGSTQSPVSATTSEPLTETRAPTSVSPEAPAANLFTAEAGSTQSPVSDTDSSAEFVLTSMSDVTKAPTMVPNSTVSPPVTPLSGSVQSSISATNASGSTQSPVSAPGGAMSAEPSLVFADSGAAEELSFFGLATAIVFVTWAVAV